MKIYRIALILCLFGIGALAQTAHPLDGHLYNDSNVSRIDVFLPADSLLWILDPANSGSNYEFYSNMVFSRAGQSDTLQAIGFRLRGNTSRQAQKKSFKLAVNRFTSGRRYHGVKKINLNGEHNDPSISRAKICWELGKRLGLPVSRASHTELYLNGQYFGLYLNLEHINDDWLSHRFGNNQGNLYKCTWPANLQYISNQPNDYKLLKADGSRVYELQTNEQLDDYSDLEEFIRILNLTPISQLECALDPVFNIEGYLKTLAFEVATGHWDNYSFNQNNFYLYKNPQSGKFEYLAYDMDNTFGIDWFNIDWSERHVDQWHNPAMPLSKRLLEIPELREIYHAYLRQVQAEMAKPDFLNQIFNLRSQLQPYVQNDLYRTLDYGFTEADWFDSYTTSQSNQHVKMGITHFIGRRNTFTASQLGSFNSAPIITNIQLAFGGSSFLVKAQIEDESQASVSLQYRFGSGGPLQTMALYDDGLHGDGGALDGWYANIFQGLNSNQLTYQVVATDDLGQSRARPCNSKTIPIPRLGELVINEFMADNVSTLADATGDFADWIELYNTSNQTIQLGNYYITDKLQEPNKWKLPNLDLAPGAFQLVWASNAVARGVWHTNFALSKGGESIGLFKMHNGQLDTVDYIHFGPQNTDISYGRSYDAAPTWQVFTSPTPNASNGSLELVHSAMSNFRVFPNPFKEFLFFENKSPQSVIIEVFNLQGALISRQIIEAFSQTTLYTPWPKGLYILKTSGMHLKYWKY